MEVAQLQFYIVPQAQTKPRQKQASSINPLYAQTLLQPIPQASKDAWDGATTDRATTNRACRVPQAHSACCARMGEPLFTYCMYV
jgi:hypothetical protein